MSLQQQQQQLYSITGAGLHILGPGNWQAMHAAMHVHWHASCTPEHTAFRVAAITHQMCLKLSQLVLIQTLVPLSAVSHQFGDSAVLACLCIVPAFSASK